MCMINGAIIVHRETINWLLHMVWCPLTCPTNNAKQRSCNRVYAGFRWCTKERILIIYSDTNAKVVFFLLSFQPASNELFLCPVRSGSSRPPHRRGVALCSARGEGAESLCCKRGGTRGKTPQSYSILLPHYYFLIYVLLIQLAVEYA